MPAASSIKVMVADDQLTIRALVRGGLQQLGFKDIDEAPDGEEALRQLIVKPVQLIISDYNMPKLDGLNLLRAVRSHVHGQHHFYFLLILNKYLEPAGRHCSVAGG